MAHLDGSIHSEHTSHPAVNAHFLSGLIHAKNVEAQGVHYWNYFTQVRV